MLNRVTCSCLISSSTDTSALKNINAPGTLYSLSSNPIPLSGFPAVERSWCTGDLAFVPESLSSLFFNRNSISMCCPYPAGRFILVELGEASLIVCGSVKDIIATLGEVVPVSKVTFFSASHKQLKRNESCPMFSSFTESLRIFTKAYNTPACRPESLPDFTYSLVTSDCSKINTCV